jgi:hypothetical protein
VTTEHAPAPDAQERLRRAYDLIVRASARAEDPAAEGGQGEHAGQNPQGMETRSETGCIPSAAQPRFRRTKSPG